MFVYANRTISLVFQPKYHIDSHTIVGFEVLSRCSTLDGESVGIETFVDVLRKMGLINEFTLLVAAHAIGEMKLHGFDHLSLSINCFHEQLEDEHFMNNFIQSTQRYKGQIIVELSEKDKNHSKDKQLVLANMKRNNIIISLDDFGKDNATLFELLTFDYQEVKLDKKIIDTIRNTKTSSFIASILSFLSSHNITLIAEGVEDKQDLQLLKGIGVKYAQGYVYSRPKAIEEFVESKTDSTSTLPFSLSDLKNKFSLQPQIGR